LLEKAAKGTDFMIYEGASEGWVWALAGMEGPVFCAAAGGDGDSGLYFRSWWLNLCRGEGMDDSMEADGESTICDL
jgi:hypothetical protein